MLFFSWQKGLNLETAPFMNRRKTIKNSRLPLLSKEKKKREWRKDPCPGMTAAYLTSVEHGAINNRSNQTCQSERG